MQASPVLELSFHVVGLLPELDSLTVNLMNTFYIAIKCFFGLSVT